MAFGGFDIEPETDFLRRFIVQLRGALGRAVLPEVQATLREAIIVLEDRLAGVHELIIGPKPN
jgi:hypothetical protein